MIETAVFVLAAAVAVAAGIAMVVAKNSVHAALFLVATQVAIAVLFLLQGAFFIAALQVIVYAGAIMVLFLFVVMLLGVDQKEALYEELRFQRSIAFGLGLLLLAESAMLGVTGVLEIPVTQSLPTDRGNVETVAESLFTEWAFPFEVTSLLLVVAIVGVMVLAKRRLEP